MNDPVMFVDASEVDEEMMELIQDVIALGVEVHILPHEKFQEHRVVPTD